MIKDILCKSDVLKQIFTIKVFQFLEENINEQEKIQDEIKLADSKRNKIIEYIRNIEINEKEISGTNPKKLREYVNSAESAFESINCLIRNYAFLLNSINEIESEIVNILEKKENDYNANVFFDIEKINNKIDNYEESKKVIQNEIVKYEILISNFLKKNKDEISSENKTVSVNSNNFVEIPNFELKDNFVLRVSEKEKKVYLPYTKSEIEDFLKTYPAEYKNAQDVINQEFITDISIYNKHPVLARFRESFSLIRNKEMKSSVDALKFAMGIMFRSEINPTIIAAAKSQQQLELYIECLEKDKLSQFNCFDIIFEVNPI